jgi:PAS domain S-box-containing protein
LNVANDQDDVVLANLPAGRTESRVALVIALVLLGIAVVLLPFGRVRLPRIDASVAITDTFIFIADLITWFLLISQFNIARSRALLVLASGYLFTAVMNVPHLLTFPGVFTPTGLLGAGIQTPAWLGVVMFLGYPLAILFYAVLKTESETLVSQGSTPIAVAASVAIVIAIAIALTWIAISGEPYLPKIAPGRNSSAVNFLHVGSLLPLPTAVALLLLTGVVLFLLWFRGRSVLHLWLMVVMCGWLAHGIALWTIASERYTLQWYGARFLYLISMTVVLVVLLKETMILYGRLAVSLVALRRLSAEKLQRSEAYLAEAQRLSHTGSFGRNVSSGEIHWSDETYRIFGLDRSVKPTLESTLQRIHPDDVDHVRRAIDRATSERTGYDVLYRLLRTDGSVKHLHVIARALEPSSDELEIVGAVTDVTAAKQAEEKIRQSETEFRQILDFAPQQVAVLGPDSSRLYANQATLDYYGFTLEEWRKGDPGRYVHPEDRERFQNEARSKLLSGLPHEAEMRFVGKDGKYRWFLYRWNPLRDEQGRLIRWYVAATDIEDRKQAEQRLQDENVSLREEIDKASMFEEIVGTSRPLQTVLSLISKVAPTDSSVLVTGETGTGKELVARAIHKRSLRSSRPFVGVNCAAIPRDLIGSELFGHEKGAFTGAIQRRIGRFEFAEGGTIFLDEIGELPAETQIALLRVLQEHEFERVGRVGTIPTNVRVIAATNRNLEATIAAGMFRSDLYYRLNVFPIEMPPLRERREDIPLLVEYFIDRFARKAGKRFQTVNKKSLALLESYPWPGNIRELQNVIERSVIVCETENFSVDESWLSRRSTATGPSVELGLARELRSSQEKAIIEAALTECQGQVSGPSGAAVKLGIPGSTLESKIKSLKIDKHRFKSAYLSTTDN